jgi:hypothetical protein
MPPTKCRLIRRALGSLLDWLADLATSSEARRPENLSGPRSWVHLL